MNTTRRAFFCIMALLSIAGVRAKVTIHDHEDVKVTLSGKFSNSTDTHINATLLNSKAVGARGDKIDRAFVNKSKVELTANAQHKKGVEAQATLRSKLSWGRSRVSTGSTSIKFGEALIGSHSHGLERNNIYLQEAWVTLDFEKLLGIDLWNQSCTVGLFPFQLGRGISLGENYAVDPSSLGFYSDNSVDQYAPGIKLSGNLYYDSLKYDVYWSAVQNATNSLKDTGAQIYDQLLIGGAYPASNRFARGAWDLDWRLAGRLCWTPINNKEERKKVYFEPYAMYSRDPSQKLEFTGDASSKLGTFGLSADFQYGPLEFGFEGAFNRGHQDVLAWDRNKTILEVDSSTGNYRAVHSHVYDDAALTTRTAVTSTDTATAFRPASGISSAMNSQLIDGTTKYNASNRFRDAYTNKYKGWMFVADVSMYVYKRDLKVAAAAGISSGDINPNTRKSGSNRDYKGFITQQELYCGQRVKSSFVMGAVADLIRPNPLEAAKPFVTGIEGFTNIIFAGMGATFAPKDWAYDFSINPNIITYWQDAASKKFAEPTVDASNRLGVEINTFATLYATENLEFNATAALFLPGKHYTDLKGTALNAEVATLVKEAEAGVTETLPTFGDNRAFSLSVGMKYAF